MVQRLRMWMRALTRRGAVEREMHEEMRQHIDLATVRLMARGLSRSDAHAQAKREFGNVTAIAEQGRDVWRWTWVEDAIRDASFAWRTVARSRGFSAVAALTIALSVGAVTTVFSALYGVLWAPLPYRDASRIVTVWQSDKRLGSLGMMSPPNVLDLRQRSGALSSVAAAEQHGVVYATPTGPERLPAWLVSEGFFEALGASPLLGRTFSADEFRPNGRAVVVLDYDTWHSRFGDDTGLVGRQLIFDGTPTTVVGVMPRGFRFPEAPGIWLPKVWLPAELLRRDAAYFRVIARIRGGASPSAAAAEVGRVAAQLQQEYSQTNRDVAFRLVPLRESLVGPARGRLVLLMSAALLLLLIACANLLGLMLARMVARERELAVRATLGAGPGRLLRQLLVECLVLTALGGAGGVAFALGGVTLVRHWSEALLPRAEAITLSPAVLGFSLLATCASAAFFGVLPALSGARAATLTSELRVRGSSASRSRRAVYDGLIVSEIAIATILLFGAALLGHSLLDLSAVPRGFRSSNIAAVSVQSWFANPTVRERVAYVRAVEAALAAVPGVDDVGTTTSVPFGGTIDADRATLEIIGDAATTGANAPTVHAGAVTPGYFNVLAIGLTAGRAFSISDDADRVPVAIVNQALVRAYFGRDNPIGKRIRVALASAPVEREIVGVVADVRDVSLSELPRPTVFIPHAQSGSGANVFVVRTASDARALLPSLRRALTTVSSSLPVASATTLDDMIANSILDRRVVLLLVAAFAAAALGLAVFGIYGLISRIMTQRTRELGIRLALGARPEDLFWLMMGGGIRLALIGGATGLVTALAAARGISSMLYGVGPADALALVTGAAVVSGAALAATWIPARRAARLEAVAALREDDE